MANKGDLKIWHIPQVPGTTFEVPVSSIEEGAKLLVVLAKYDIFQFIEKVKPDYSNAQGLLEFDGDEWFDWHGVDDEYDGIDEWMDEHDTWSILNSEPYWIEANKTRRY